jgi:hypothetical protein
MGRARAPRRDGPLLIESHIERLTREALQLGVVERAQEIIWILEFDTVGSHGGSSAGARSHDSVGSFCVVLLGMRIVRW